MDPTADAEPLFEIDSLELRRDAEPQIAALRARLAESTSPIVAVEWYGADTSERGLDLTRRRAQRLLVALREGAPEGAVLEARGCYASPTDRSPPSAAIARLCPGDDYVWCERLPARRVGGGAAVWRIASP